MDKIFVEMTDEEYELFKKVIKGTKEDKIKLAIGILKANSDKCYNNSMYGLEPTQCIAYTHTLKEGHNIIEINIKETIKVI